VTISVTVEGRAETVVVTGISVKTNVAMMASMVVVSVEIDTAETEGDGAEDEAGMEDIEDGSIKKRMPSIVVIAESAAADLVNKSVLAGVIKFSAGLDPGTVGTATAVQTASVKAKKSGIRNIRAAGSQATMKDVSKTAITILTGQEEDKIWVQPGTPCDRWW
jgi:hypothetical protein